MHVIAAKGVAFGEALQPGFKTYIQQVIDNAKHAGRSPSGQRAIRLPPGGTDNHLLLVDLRDKKITGKAAEQSLGRAHITCNKNGVPFDEVSPDGDVGHPPRLAGGDVSRLRLRRVHQGGRADRHLPRRPRRTTATRATRRSRPRSRDEVAELTKRFPIY